MCQSLVGGDSETIGRWSLALTQSHVDYVLQLLKVKQTVQ